MSWRRWGGAVVLALILAPAGAQEPPPDDPPLPVRADETAVRQVLRERQVVMRPARPNPTEYLADVAMTVGRWLAELFPAFGRVGRLLGAVDPRWLWALVLALTLAGVLRALRRRPPSAAAPVRHRTPSPPPEERDWQATLESRLEAGDARGALEALWWWFAERLAERLAGGAGGFAVRVAATRTGRELVVAAGRTDLLANVRTLDRLRYGTAPPAVEAVRRCWRQLAEALT